MYDINQKIRTTDNLPTTDWPETGNVGNIPFVDLNWQFNQRLSSPHYQNRLKIAQTLEVCAQSHAPIDVTAIIEADFQHSSGKLLIHQIQTA